MNCTTSTQASGVLKRINNLISECLFIMPKINPAAFQIESDKIEGWTSSWKLPYANRVRLKSFDKIEETVALTLAHFQSTRTPFTWVVGEYEKGLNFTNYLMDIGFQKSMYPSVAGMYYNIDQFNNRCHNQTVIESNSEFLNENISVIAEGFNYNSDLASFLFSSLRATDTYQPKSFFFQENKCSQLVGYGASVHINQNNAVLLRGSCVLPKFRRQGIYESLVIARLNNARDNGLNFAITHSALNSSYSTLKKLGFIESTRFDLYEWNVPANL